MEKNLKNLSLYKLIQLEKKLSSREYYLHAIIHGNINVDRELIEVKREIAKRLGVDKIVNLLFHLLGKLDPEKYDEVKDTLRKCLELFIRIPRTYRRWAYKYIMRYDLLNDLLASLDREINFQIKVCDEWIRKCLKEYRERISRVRDEYLREALGRELYRDVLETIDKCIDNLNTLEEIRKDILDFFEKLQFLARGCRITITIEVPEELLLKMRLDEIREKIEKEIRDGKVLLTLDTQ